MGLADYDVFGRSVSVSGDTLVVGASGDDTPGGVDAGSAHVYTRSGTIWQQHQTLLASDAGPSDFFGSAVSASGDTLVIGALGDDTSGGIDAGSAYVFVRSGTTWVQQQKLTASDPALYDQFGSSVSISGDTVVVGTPLHDTAAGSDAGSAYVFIRSGTTWSEQQELVAGDGEFLAWFGSSVSVASDTAVIGAYGDTPLTGGGHNEIPDGGGAGSAYVFVRSGTSWSQQQKLMASDGVPADEFGRSVSISADTVVVGAALHDTPGGGSAGAAYVFVRSGTTWTEQQKLLASDGAGGNRFGSGVAVSGDTVVGGAPYNESPPGTFGGAAYAFVRSGTTWTQQQKFLSDSPVNDTFGYSVSASGDTVVVAAPQDNVPAGATAGSAYVFVRSGPTWMLQEKLLAPDGTQGDFFGASVSIAQDTLVVGAVNADTPGGIDAGAAYVFVRSGTAWTLQQKLVAPDASPADLFGVAVSVHGDTAVVGAFADDTPAGNDSGSAYVFARSGTTWSLQQKILAADGAATDYFGSRLSVFGDTVVVGAAADDAQAGAYTGSAYVFVRSGVTWAQQQKLFASDGSTNDYFGSSVSVIQDLALVGAPGDDTAAGGDSGSAYIFVRSGTTWTQQQKLLASDASPSGYFGTSVSVSGDTAVVGALGGGTPSAPYTGSAYVFARSGTTWSEEEEIVPPDGISGDAFGNAASISGSTMVIGADLRDGPSGENDGAAYVFRAAADVGVTKSDGQNNAIPGEPLTYTIAVSNAGPNTATGVIVADPLPPALLAPSWTCSASSGSSCTPSGAGSINDIVSLPAGGTATYTVTGTISPAATGSLVNTVTITPPGGVNDPNPANNTATDVDTLAPETDLGITKTDSADPVSPNDPLTYAVTVTNHGPSDATGVTMVDTLPAGVTFVSSVPGPPTCVFSAGTLTCTLGVLVAGSSTAVTINVTVNAGAGGILTNTAVVSGAEPDPQPNNNTASAATSVGRRDGELAHGSDAVFDLAAQPGPVADEDTFRISQKPRSSYEVVVDATSGDIGAGSGPALERVAPDGVTVIQESAGIGVGPSRTLRWRNTSTTVVEGEAVRVRSAGCGTDCGPDDVYRIRAYETTYSVPRFNNAGTQITVLVLQNPTSDSVSGEVYFVVSSGAPAGVHPFVLTPKATLVLNTATVPGANGVSGVITIAHDGRYGELSGKTVALEPSTGFSFDTALEPRR